METQVIINKYPLSVSNYKEETIQKGENSLKKLIFDFQVSHEEYHDITTLLYQNEFEIEVPERTLAFQGSICNYWTSFTNLYEEGAVGDFHLELIQK
ncbi:DUF3219 family protein [Peribacillus kribbensis]|uniref:DUF3219 family protein n=1 Tax=Peribacillus kribbensis TaxID=356658 RepID=UPI000421A1A0|nr:DUF3219 family protein [Peribacillus kribbensis]